MATSAATRPKSAHAESEHRSRSATFLRDNGLSIGLLVLFLGSLVGHVFAGYAILRKDADKLGETAGSVWSYMGTAHFRESLFENWESEFLQMFAYVLMTAWLYQRGSAESKDPDKQQEDVDEDPRLHRMSARAPGPVRRGGFLLVLYCRSLSIALLLLFFVSFVMHLISGHDAFDAERRVQGLGPSAWSEYLSDPQPWFESFQNWQSEFLSVAVVVILSIFLRQIGSPESKPVHSAHADTGR